MRMNSTISKNPYKKEAEGYFIPENDNTVQDLSNPSLLILKMEE